MTDPNTFYTFVVEAFAEIRHRIKLATDHEINITIYDWNERNRRLDCRIETNGYGLAYDKVEVKGHDLFSMADEYIRRARFADSQSNLQLGPPIIDGEIKP